MPRSAVIHCNPAVAWHVKRGSHFAEGFRRAGIPCRIVNSPVRLDEGLPVLLGTTFWREIERDGGDYLLVDRCSFGDTETFVQLVWNGHGRRGDHRIPANANGERWKRYGMPMQPWQRKGHRIVLCGQTESYSPSWPDLEAWYAHCREKATHFRPHPAGENPTDLPVATDWRDVKLAITLNSSIGVKAVLDGVPTVTMDEASMAWDVTTHDLESEPVTPERTPWAHRLAWTMWSDQEIREGALWASHW